MNLKSLILASALFVCANASAVTDFFGVQKMTFLGTDYHLVWSANTQNNTRIEDFLPKGPSYTQFEKKLSVYNIQNGSFEKIVLDKQNELVSGKQEGNVLDFKNVIINDNEIMCSYTSELSQDGVVLVVQFSAFRYIRTGTSVNVIEWEHRSYKNADSFKAKIDKNKSKWLSEFKKVDISKFNLK
ncbi:MAG: hypothetical protein II623_12360 [Paludibacteraceae bacterium]|nr:hypothetical protein [Paludibacteraceae bacterium]MBR6043729.1 hypothetical protein [Paludibacteraceae bacterium]